MHNLIIMMLKKQENRQTISQILDGFRLNKISKNQLGYVNAKQERIILTKENGGLKFVKVKAHEIVITLLNGHVVREETIDFRSLGIKVTKTEKKYSPSKNDEKRSSLNYLYSTSMCFTNESINRIFKRLEGEIPAENIIDKMMALERCTFLEYEADCKNSIEISATLPSNPISVIVDNYHLNSSNGEETDYSKLYAPVEGNNAIERIYSLYNGLITKENLVDFQSINQEKMNPMAYGLKEVIGLKDVEDLLIGESQPLQTPEQIPFLEDYFRKNFNVTHVNFNNRNNVVASLLVDSIHHKKYKKNS